MPGMDGMKVCEEIRKTAPDMIVVFISNKEELVFQTFALKPFRFIRKSHLKESVGTLVHDIAEELKAKDKKVFRFTEGHSGDSYSFDISTVLYVESFGKKCMVHRENDEVEVNCQLKFFEDELAPIGFVRVHRSYLVNQKAIFRLNKTDVVLTNGESI